VVSLKRSIVRGRKHSDAGQRQDHLRLHGAARGHRARWKSSTRETFAFQAHDPKSTTYYKNIMVQAAEIAHGADGFPQRDRHRLAPVVLNLPISAAKGSELSEKSACLKKRNLGK